MLTRMSSDGEIPPMPTPTYGKILGLADKAAGSSLNFANALDQTPGLQRHPRGMELQISGKLFGFFWGPSLFWTLGPSCLPRSITVCYFMLHPAISPAILEFPVIAGRLFRCFEISLLAESQVNNIVTAVSFGMTLGVTVSVVLNLVQPGSHRSS